MRKLPGKYPIFLLFLLIYPSCKREIPEKKVQVIRPNETQLLFFENLLDLSLGPLQFGTSLLLKPNSSGTEGWVLYGIRGTGEVKLLHFFLSESGTQQEITHIGSPYDSFQLLLDPQTETFFVVAHQDPTLGGGGLYLLTKEGNQFRPTLLDPAPLAGRFMEAKIDPEGGIHIAYGEDGDTVLKYILYKRGSILLGPVVVDTGVEQDMAFPGGNITSRVSIDLNNNLEPSISYYDSAGQILKVARYQSRIGTWQIEVIGNLKENEILRPSPDGTASTSQEMIAMKSQITLYKDLSPLPSTGYELISPRSLKIAFYDPSAEYSIDYLTRYSTDYGSYSTIRYQPDLGIEGVLFYDQARGDLIFATNPNPGSSKKWNFEPVDTLGNVGSFHDLRYFPLFTKEGVQKGYIPVVAYFDESNGDLLLAYRFQKKWFTSTIDRSGWSGYFPSLAISEDGYAVVAYNRVDPRDLSVTLRIIRTIPIRP